MKLLKAEGCAWRGRYLYRDGGAQIARVVLDPHGGVRPSLTIAVGRLELRIPLPFVPWSWCSATRYARPVVWLYKLSQALYHNLDGRYGWAGRS